VATQLNASKLYPLRRISSEKDLAAQACSTTVQFEKDPEFGLQHKLIVRFVIQLIDDNAGHPMYKAASCCALADDNGSSCEITSLTDFFTGELGALLDSTVLEQQLATALDAAYVEQDKGQSSLNWKSPVLPHDKEEQ